MHEGLHMPRGGVLSEEDTAQDFKIGWPVGKSTSLDVY
jgi:hypothetical protein